MPFQPSKQYAPDALERRMNYNRPVVPGNIDLKHRPIHKNPDGSISTVLSTSFGTDQGEVLVPMIREDGKLMDEQEALQHYQRTGKHLGIFRTPEAANAYAQRLHKDQARQYAPESRPRARFV